MGFAKYLIKKGGGGGPISGTYQVHKDGDYTLKRSYILCQCNVEIFNEVLEWASLQNIAKRVSFLVSACAVRLHLAFGFAYL